MASIFYRAAYERQFPLTMLFLELLQTSIAEEGAEEFTADQLVPLILKCLVKAGLREKAKKSDADYVITRLTSMMEEAQSAGDASSSPPPKKQTFASSYSAWAAALEPDALCLAASSFDYFQAERLYKDVDKEDVIWLADQYLRAEWEKIKVGFESVVYGFGGSYKGDSSERSGGADTYDLTKESAKGLAALKKVL